MSSTDTAISQLAINQPNAVYFVNSDLVDLATLLAGVPQGAEVVLLDPTQDGLSQMLTALDGRSGLDAIHLIGHGASGLIDLGSTSVTEQTLIERAADIATLGSALTSTGDILLYGCDVGAGVLGAAFMQQLASLSGADVAASTDLTGAAAQGGNWVLEAQTGAIEAQAIAPIDYSGVLSGYWYSHNAGYHILGPGGLTLYADWDGGESGIGDFLNYNNVLPVSSYVNNGAEYRSLTIGYDPARAGQYWSIDLYDAPDWLSWSGRYYNSAPAASSGTLNITEGASGASVTKTLDLYDIVADSQFADSWLTYSGTSVTGHTMSYTAAANQALKGSLLVATQNYAASDGYLTGNSNVKVYVTYANDVITWTAPPANQTWATKGAQSFNFGKGAQDPDTIDSVVSYTIVSVDSVTTSTPPAWMKLTGSTLSVANLTPEHAGETHTFVVRATSNDGSTIDKTFTITTGTAEQLNDLPTSVGPAARAMLEDGVLTFTAVDFHFVDLDNTIGSSTAAGAVLTGVRIDTLPTVGSGVLKYNNGTAVVDVTIGQTLTTAELATLTFTPVANYFNTTGSEDSFTFSLYDGVGYALASTTLKITVTSVNDVPYFTTSLGAEISPVVALTATLADTAAYDSSVNATGDLTGTLYGNDVESGTGGISFSIRGGNVDVSAHTVTKAGLYGTLTLDTSHVWTYVATNYAAINALPAGATATESFDMQVIDAAGATALQPLVISLTGSNDTPVVATLIADQPFSGAGNWSYQIPAASFTDAEGTGLTYSVEVVPNADGSGTATCTIGANMIAGDGSLPSSWLTFDAATRTFSGNPSVLWGDAPLNLKVTATDSAGVAVSDTFSLTLTNTGNQLPTVQNPLTWKVASDAEAWSYQVPVNTFLDAEGDTLTYSAWTVVPDGSGGQTATALVNSEALTFNSTNLKLTGDGTADSSTIIEIRATDAAHTGSSYAASQFQLVVNTAEPTDSAVIAVTDAIPASVAFANGPGVASYTVPAAAFDIAGSTSTTVSYAATLSDGTTALPNWLTFNPGTGTFSGNPPNGTASIDVKVTATVGGSNTATTAFTLGITAPNDPLVVTAHLPDRTVTTGSVDFTVPLLFSDPDGGTNSTATTDGITYSATLADDTALPGWLVFNETTRAFSGNPPAGTPYLNIKVTGTETAGGSTTATSFTLNLSDASAYAAAANNLGTVTITGTAALGNTLTATPLVDADGRTLHTAVAYQWQASSDSGTSWTDVLGARGLASTLTLAQTESHQQVRVQAFYNDNGGFAEAPVSNAITVPTFNVAGVVTISGALSPGKTLLATVVDANGLSGLSTEPAFQWYRGATADFTPGESNKIAGATNSLYTLVIDDGSQYLKAVASYTDAEGTLETPAGVSGQIQLGPLAPVAANDTPADVTENYGALNAAVVSTPPTGNLLSNDTDANAGDTKTLTELRLGGVEGIGTNATVTDSGTTLTMVGRYGTLVVTSGTVGVAANAGQYTYTVDQNNVEVEALQSGVHLTETFNYSVMDSAELSDTGVLTLTINGANDLLAITGVPATLVVTEDVASNIDLSSVSLNDVDHVGSTFKLVASQGTLAATGNSGVTVTGTGTATLTLAGTNIAIQDFLAVASNIQYTSALNDNGASGATLTLTGNDGVSGFIALGTVALDITAINDAPAGADKSVTVLEDVTYTFAAADFGFSDVFDTFADAGSGVANVLKSVLITTLPSNGKLQLSGVDVIAGTSIAVADLSGNLKFVPVANENNQSTAGTTEYVTFTFQVQDDGGSSGIELDQSPNIFTVNVTPVNDAPVLQNAGTSAPVLVTIDENAIANTGHLISTLVRAVDGTNPTDNLHSVITDVDFATQGTTGGSPNEAWDGGIAIYDLSNTGPADGGKWQYKLDSTWVDVGTVSETQALLLRSTDSLRFLPDADNATTATVSYYVWDGSNTTTAGTLVSVITANRGGTTAFSTASDTATITVTPVNDAPTLDLDGNNSSGANGASYITTFLARGAEVAVVDGDITILDVDQNSRTDVAQQDRISKAVVLIDPALAADNMLGTIDETLVFKDGDVAVSSWSGLTITGNGTGDSGLTSATELTITGPATWATYQGALQKVFYNNTNLAPTQGDRTVSITVTDNNDTAGPNDVLTATATTTVLLPGIAVVDLNGPLAAGANFTVTFTEGDLPGKAVAATNAAIDNQGGLKIKTVTLSLSNSPDGVLEKLFLSTAQVTYLSSKGITVQNNDSHAVTLAATDANVGVEVNFMNTGLRYVQYVNSSENPVATARVVNVSVQDMDMVGQSAKTTITVVPVNDAPTGAVTIANDTDAGRGITAAQQNDVLSVTNTLADLDGPATLTGITYQWQSGGVNVSGATGSTYTLTQADVGKVMTVVASYTDASATVEHKTSAATNAVVNVNDAPVINAIAQTDLNETISTVLTANIPITFTDIDPLDVGHTASVSVAASGVTTGLALDATQLAALMTLGTVTKASGSTAGSLTPVFSATATAFDYLAAGEVLTLTYTLTVADVGSPAKNDTKVFVIQITGTNDEPVITAAEVGAVTEQLSPSGNLTDTGSISFTDVDLTDVHLVSASGTYLGSDTALGALTAVKTADTTGTGAGGALSWTYSVAASTVEYLAKDQTRVESFTITINDQNGSTITKQIDVTITGTNDVPVITAEDLAGAVAEQQLSPSGNLTDTGSISFTDMDLTDVHLVSASGTYLGSDTALGTLTAVKTADTTGTGGALSWTYSVAASTVEYLAAGEPRIESFTITLSDQNGSTITKQIDVTITGTNDAPVITAEDLAGAVTEQQLSPSGNLTDTGSITFTDVDLTDMYLVSASGTYLGSDTALGTLTAVKTADATGTGGALSWTYSVAASAVEYMAKDQTRIESFTITLNDKNGSSITKQIDVTITGTNDVPVITAEDLTGAVTEQQLTPSGNLTDTGSITFTDVDLTDVHLVSANGTYLGSDTALGALTAVKTADTTGTGAGGALSWTYSVAASAVEYLTKDQTRVESFTITINDQNGSIITKQIDVTITGTNDVPVLAHSLINQSLSVAGPIATYTFAADTFADIDQGTVLSYTAQVWNSSTSTATTLPDWLHFDAGTRTFSGNPPAGSPSLTVRVTASDGALTTTGDFVIALPDTHVNDVHLTAPAGDVEVINNLVLPQTLKVTDVTDNSKVTITGTGNTTVDTPAGDIAIDNAGTGTTEVVGLKDDKTVTTSGTGPTTIENPAGDVTVANTGSGDVKVNGANDGKTVTTTGDKPVTVSNPDGDVKVNNTGTGTSTVTDVKDGKTVTTSGTGPTTVENPAGDVTVANTGSGDVKVNGANDGKTVTTSGTGPTTVENPAGDVTVANTGSGDVKVNGANDNATVTATGTKPVTISNPDGNVNVVNDGTGLVTVSGVHDGSTVNSTGSGPQTVDLSNLVSGQSVTIDNDGTGLVNLIHVPDGVTVHFTGTGPTTVSSLSGHVTLDNQGTSLVTVANDATIANGSTIHTTGTGPIKFDTDIPTGNTVHVDIAGNSNVTFDNDGAGTLDVTGATNATLTSTSSGPMTVTDPVGNLTVNNTGNGPLVVSGLDTGKELAVNGNGPTEVKSPDGDVTVTNNGTGLVNIKDVLDGKTIHTAGTGPIIINTELGVDKKVIVDLTGNHNVQITNTGSGVVESQGDLTLDSTHALAMTLTGKDTTVLTETGTVALNNAPLRLNLATGYTPMVGEIITLIANDSTDAVFGTFAGLPEGTVVHVGAYQFTISYVGGTGNDVVLTVNSAPTGSVFISGTPTQGDTLTATNTLADINVIPTSGTGAISYQWQADGVAINGATASTFVLTQAQVAKAVNVVASYIDGIGSHESQVSASTMVHTTASGSTPLAQQSVVSTVAITPTGSSTTSVVSLALNTGLTNGVITDSIVVSQHAGTAITTPSVLVAPVGVFDLSSHGNTTGGENFSLYVDKALAVNGYWVQNASGTFVNLASAAFGGRTVIEGDKIRLDFTIQDGGQFDTTNTAGTAHGADGTITASGAAAHMELSIIGHVADVPTGGIFF